MREIFKGLLAYFPCCSRLTSMEQKRFSTRRRVLKAGLIAFEGATVVCTIRNVSSGGVAIEIKGSVEIPETFKLVVEADNFISCCRVAWRQGRRVGVSFA
jgi:hypothetical protein